MKRKGSIIAREIIQDMKREEYFKKKAKRNVCIINNKRQCDKCKFNEVCEDVNIKNEIL